MHRLTACEIAAQVRQRRISALSTMAHFLDRTARHEPQLNTYAALDAEGALAAAREIDRRIAAGEDPGPLAGVPVSVKDLIAVQGLPQAFGSRLFAGSLAAHDAPSVARIRQAGGCIVGKTTTSELGSKAVGSSPLTGTTVNPWRPAHTPGGSSAGAAAGVAAGLVPLALGTDGGGSIRIPASFCGLVGIKGSYGRVPVWPASATPGLAHVAPLARTVRDAVLLFSVVAGPHPGDPSSEGFAPLRWEEGAHATPGLRLGWCEDFSYGWASGEARAAAWHAAGVLGAALGAATSRWQGLADDPVEAWSTEFYRGIAQRVGVADGADRAIEAQLDPALAAQIALTRERGRQGLREASEARQRCIADIDRAFERFDLLLMPTTPVAAFETGRDAPAGREACGAVGWSYFTYPFNLAGHPAASYPIGLDCGGLPLGVQLVARRGDEALLFDALLALERAAPPPPLPSF
ncbi:amidase [Variovorax terrae]|uniref:Amidase n=1 Tax=Variovorax terrae TaxID=2923278 RepID=A0A9X1VVW2_9BURK|nr:amidase [Variovorax terrae]MCJ0764230.1 amidase [Variovorax terrae]